MSSIFDHGEFVLSGNLQQRVHVASMAVKMYRQDGLDTANVALLSNQLYNGQHAIEFRWLHESFGTNGRLTEMQSAMGRVLLRKLPRSVESRRRNSSILTRGFTGLPGLRVTPPPNEIGHSYYKYYVFIQPERLRKGWDRDRIRAAINAEGIPCFNGICSEIYLEKAFREDLRPRERMTVARELGETSLMFLVHPTLSEKDMLDICHTVEKVMNAAAK